MTHPQRLLHTKECLFLFFSAAVSPAHRRTKAKLVHWNGSGKPWLYPGTFYTEWMRYHVADPAGRFKPRNAWKERRVQRIA